MGDYLVVDADGHLLEPADLWVRNLPARFKGVALRTVYDRDAQGEAVLVDEDTVVMQAPNAGAVGAARFPAEKRRTWAGVRSADGDPASFDPDLRVREQDREGIDVAVLYPSLGLFLNGVRDREHARLACEIYNDWLADFCRHAPDRMVGIATLPWQDPPAAARELRRAVEQLGFRGAFLRPNAYGEYHVHAPEFDAVWAEAQDLGVPIGIHPGGTPEVWGAAQLYRDFSLRWRTNRFPGYKIINFLFDNYFALCLLVGAGVLERFPRLKVIVLESGGGWLPHWLDQMDHYGEMKPTERDGLSLLPSQYFRRQCYISCDPDDSAYRFLPSLVGADRLMWASDFPHLDVTAPSVTEELWRSLEGTDEETRRQVLGETAIEAYGLDRARLGRASRPAADRA